MTQDTATLIAARPSRRSVTRAAAWGVPVIAVATTAPAYAASCAPVRATSASITSANRVSSVEWTATFDVDGRGRLPSNVLTAKATFDAGMGVRNDANGGVNDNFSVAGAVGGLGTSGLVLAQRATTANPSGALGHYAFSFTRPVTDLSFTLTDIDSTTGDFWDSVWLTPGFTVGKKAAGIQGAGTSASPFKQATGNSAFDNASGGGGNVTLTYAGPISSFQINYSNVATSFAAGADPDQVVTIADLAFDFQPC